MFSFLEHFYKNCSRDRKAAETAAIRTAGVPPATRGYGIV